MMISAVTLNPCVDRTLFLHGLDVGGHNVAERVQNDVSGKGINVNVVLSNLNIPTKAVGFEFDHNGPILSNFLRQHGIPFDKFCVDAELRVNTKIFDAQNAAMTEINCKGPTLSPEISRQMLKIFEASLEDTDLLVIDGSIPPGIPRDIYKTMTELAHTHGIPVVLDATGELLEKALKAKPELVKPNRGELELLLGRTLETRQECVLACRELIARGVGAVCLSLGGEGALYVNGDSVWFSPGLDIQVKSFQGAGDSIVAGICLGMLADYPPEELLRSGVAAAHGSLLQDGTRLCTYEDYLRLLPQIPVVQLTD